MRSIDQFKILTAPSAPRKKLPTLVSLATAVLLSVWVIVIVQKYLKYGGSPNYSLSASVIFNLIAVVPFAAFIGGAVAINERIRRYSTAPRFVVALTSSLVLFATYTVIINAILYAIGLSSQVVSESFVMKYATGMIHIHAAVYLIAQILTFPRRQGQESPPGPHAESPMDARPVPKLSPAAVPQTSVSDASSFLTNVPFDLDEVRWIEADDHYLRFYNGNDSHLERGTMRRAAVLLPSGYLRIHRKYIVNIAHVQSVMKEGRELYVVVGDGCRLKVSRSRQAEVHRKIEV